MNEITQAQYGKNHQAQRELKDIKFVFFKPGFGN